MRALCQGLIALSAWMAGCATPTDHAIDAAIAAGYEPLTVRGTTFRHAAYFRAGARDGRLWVFIDGDGTPWLHHGTVIAGNPSLKKPLVLRLATATPGSVLYLGRPCYLQSRQDPACRAPLWTSERYGEAVIASMAAAANAFAAQRGFTNLVLVGYSGGGTLAVLVAPRIPSASAVVTIAGNLDTDAWTRLHGYDPLLGSLNPARQPRLPVRIRELHLVGTRDRNVPPDAMRRYLDRLPPALVWPFDAFDHDCCWLAHWSSIHARLEEWLR